MKAHLFSPAAVATLAAFLSLPLDAQIRGSERAVVTQTVDGTTISVEYARPRARGRDPVFGAEGGIVDWGHIWTPGADWATTFEFSSDVELNGQPVPQGKYSVWMIAQPDLFEVILDPNHRVFHMARPSPTEEQIRTSAVPTEGPFAEVLTFSFPLVQSDGADLVFQWGTTQVPMHVSVQSTQTLTVEAEAAEPYPGVYDVVLLGPPQESIPPAERWHARSRMELIYSDGHLTAQWGVGGNQADENGMLGVMMIPVSDQVFHPGWLQDGELYETEMDIWVEFVVEGGSAISFQMRDGISDMVFAEGTRAD